MRSRRLALVLPLLMFALDARGQTSLPDVPSSPDSSLAPVPAVVPEPGDSVPSMTSMDSSMVATDSSSADSVKGDVEPERILFLPVVDSVESLANLGSMVRDALLDQVVNDTMPHGTLLAPVDSHAISGDSAIDSVGRSFHADRVVWLGYARRVGEPLSFSLIVRDPVRDSLLDSVTYVLPDSGTKTLLSVPRALLLRLFPREIPPPPRLSDSVKRVVVLPFVPQGTATAAHAQGFTDSLIVRLEGQDGFRVMPPALRDSLLSGWQPGACLTASCRREVGDRLGTPWVIAGQISQLGEKWSVDADLVRADSSVVGRHADARCQGAPRPSLDLVNGMTVRQLSGQDANPPVLDDTPIARIPHGPAWKRILALGIAGTLGLIGVVLSW
ncbi:MAG: hypothetical protein H6686_08835 [Fibrobacteria bacterium]|nr:hypothetical protein [Fibrobacteria bacterium]